MLPAVIKLCQDRIVLSLITVNDLEFYQSIYTHATLMKYIEFFQNPVDIENYFYQQCHQNDKKNKTVFNYAINLKQQKIGLLGLNLKNPNSHEMGVIIRPNFQGSNWSYQIKESLLKYLFRQQQSQQVLASCDVRNSAANHVNLKLGMKLSKVSDDLKHKRQINHWIIDKDIDSEQSIKSEENNQQLRSKH